VGNVEIMKDRVEHTDEEWKEILNPEQYRILRLHGTELPYRNAYWENHAKGKYLCAGCRAELFSSDAKFDSTSGWPSFFQPISEGAEETTTDKRFKNRHNSVRCARCGGHLGHVFSDGPAPTGLRYCMNSGAMIFVENEK
jgi:peptide-methionine (R)-S-oxide reductase